LITFREVKEGCGSAEPFNGKRGEVDFAAEDFFGRFGVDVCLDGMIGRPWEDLVLTAKVPLSLPA
jgi:hypothetical protein